MQFVSLKYASVKFLTDLHFTEGEITRKMENNLPCHHVSDGGQTITHGEIMHYHDNIKTYLTTGINLRFELHLRK